MTAPSRWNKLKPHKEQNRLWKENFRFKVVPAGRRSGKTELAKRKVVKSLLIPKPYDDPRYALTAPTYGQAKKIYWKDVKKLIPPNWIAYKSESDLVIETVFGSELHVIGMDKPERIEGVPWDGIVLDEYANMKKDAWSDNVRPSLSDRKGWAWLIGVPEGFNHYKDLADYAMSGVDPEWGFYSWHSADILDPNEVESARRMLDPKTFRQEYEASFESAEGRVYYAFDDKNLVDLEVDMNAPIMLSCDFNVDPCCWIVCQVRGGLVYALDEIVIRNTNTVDMVKEYRSRYKNPTYIYGDSAGSSRTTAGKTDYALMSEGGLNKQRIPKANPRVKDRVNAMNSMLRNSHGDRRLFIDRKCKHLIKDLQSVTWKGGSGDIDKRNPDLTHTSDALGYFITKEYGIDIYRKSGKRFYK